MPDPRSGQHPTPAEREVLREYTRDVADQMGLRDWTLDFDWTWPSDKLAEARTIDGRRYLILRWGTSFWTDTSEEQRDTVVHELLHAHMSPLDNLVGDSTMGQIMGYPAWSLLKTEHQRLLEYAVDAIAGALAPRFPLIPWRKSRSEEEELCESCGKPYGSGKCWPPDA